MIATILGYNGGPFNMWKYLYNPSNFTLFGFISTNLMNYFALLGATFLVAWTTHKHKSWKYGWSAAFIFLIVTYLVPGNLIVILQQYIGNKLIKNDIPEDYNKIIPEKLLTKHAFKYLGCCLISVNKMHSNNKLMKTFLCYILYDYIIC